jgi:REP element-mobilizing transposase RayT
MSTLRTYLYVHAVWAVGGRRGLLVRSVRTVLAAHMQKTSEEKGVRILKANGGTDHLHVLLHLHPAQNLSQVLRQIRSESAEWLNTTRIVAEPFEWEEDYVAYSVSPNVIRQVSDYIDRQEEYHLQKTYAEELAVFDAMQSNPS